MYQIERTSQKIIINHSLIIQPKILGQPLGFVIVTLYIVVHGIYK